MIFLFLARNSIISLHSSLDKYKSSSFIFAILILYVDKKLNFFDFVELYFSDFLGVKFLFILHFRFFSSF